MIKKTITYPGFDGDQEFTDDFYFHLSKAELVEMELSEVGGLEAHLEAIVKEKNIAGMVEIFKRIVLEAYGKRSEDGRRFIKSEEIRREFMETEAYSVLFMELAQDEGAAVEFINGVVPSNLNLETMTLEEPKKSKVMDAIENVESDIMKMSEEEMRAKLLESMKP